MDEHSATETPYILEKQGSSHRRLICCCFEILSTQDFFIESVCEVQLKQNLYFILKALEVF